MRIAVIGAGLGGLAAAWRLARRHQVVLFERQPRPGFTAANVAVPGRGAAANPVRVDVPLRVFYPGYYPQLSQLYQALGVPSEPVSYAGSFHGPALDGQAAERLFFRYRNLRWGGRSWPLPVAGGWWPGTPGWQISAAALRFRREALPALQRGELDHSTLGDWVAARGYPAAFVQGFLLPAVATVCTCSLAQAAAFPAAVVAGYLAGGVAGQSVHRALHGADDVQRRLLAGLPDVRCDARIAALRRLRDGPAGAAGGAQGGTDGVQLQMDDGSTERFDHAVLATPAPQALRLLANAGASASADEAAVLAGFGYTAVEVLTHTDARLMPARRRDWSPVNLWVDRAAGAVESTIWVNAVQPVLRGAADVFQTVHPLRPVDGAALLGRASFQRPVVSAASQQALAGLQALHAEPGRRVWFCGSYAQAGIPLLESAVGSAAAVAALLDGRAADSSA